MELNRKNTQKEERLPIKVVQFGEGNFLRAFVDFAFQQLNKATDLQAGIAVVQPIDRGMVDMLEAQDGLYTLFLKGIKQGKITEEKELIENIVKTVNPYKEFDQYLSLAKEETLEFVISNTTEAGIAYVESDTAEMQPPSSFPAKLTRLLFERFKHFGGDFSKGLTIIPCELINYNADTLKDIIAKYTSDWALGDEFSKWVAESCSFHNTLVDRIVPGYPKDEIEEYNKQIDCEDNLIVSAETFFLWVIEGGDELKAKLPFEKTGLDVKIVKDMQPYRTRKVRILNGAHTTMVPMSIMYGNVTVKETIENEFTGDFVRKAIFEEIVATLDMDKAELEAFAKEVLDRFLNPFIKHNLSSIALNSVSKFKVRVLPSLLEYKEKTGELPVYLTYSLACLIRFYKKEWNEGQLPVNDDAAIMETFDKIWETGHYSDKAFNVLSNFTFWGEDLTQIEGLPETVAIALREIDKEGIENGFANFKAHMETAKAVN